MKLLVRLAVVAMFACTAFVVAVVVAIEAARGDNDPQDRSMSTNYRGFLR